LRDRMNLPGAYRLRLLEARPTNTRRSRGCEPACLKQGEAR
jgi:hypothetical protein